MVNGDPRYREVILDNLRRIDRERGFVTNERLICRYGLIDNDSGMLLPFYRLIAVNRLEHDYLHLRYEVRV